ncbi:tRNA lysidine(34) synthetase TilS [Halobacillus sp. Nhm2S1]|uniref:tRNA lysidine(34) synthetase TilS n=1 Tax=Halobacillus sp. Nhm2S1 TaxID=2866716 RepID=UPI001C73873C|nr:tRNA lysidine(34) synthetase TilS [Halobacillus sp. Nhm2S1]MBX0359927.1 tRNA lysidine(34) synthetase TilS [Halobacillus sp. Nhm2S1]
MDHAVHTFISKHQMIQPHQTLLVAVSGGPDSVALLHFLCAMKHKLSLRLIALSVDHQLRGEESQADLRFVEDMCESMGVEFVGTSVDVHAYKKDTGKGTQEAARELRYAFFEKMMYAYKADAIAMGHHGDDQAETILMQLMRSARPEAVQGMPATRRFACGKIIRPFLTASKDQIASYLEDQAIEVRMDPSNEETEYTRNAIRQHLLPFMKENNPQFHKHMQVWSERAREERSYINEQAQKVLETVHFSSNVEKFVQLSKQTFKTFPLALQRTAFHLILNYLYVKQNEDISYLHEEMFMNLMNDAKPNASLDFPEGLKIIRAYDDITFSFPKEHDGNGYSYILEMGEEVQLPDGSELRADWFSGDGTEDPFTYLCDSHHVKLPLSVRTRQEGDRIRLRGMNGSKKVKDIFIDQKIPARLRPTWPIVTDQTGKILWVVGLKKGGERTSLSSGPWLRLHYKNKADT